MSEYQKLRRAIMSSEHSEIPKNNQETESLRDELLAQLRDPNFLPTRDQILNPSIFRTKDEWEDFCYDEAEPVFEFLNKEYVNAFADYFVKRIQEYSANEDSPLKILEIGAGNGRLSHFLQKKLEERVPGQTKVIATDSDEWKLKSDFPVEQLNHKEAMKQYSPDIVIFSWMPNGEDSSKDIRKFSSVQEYILIGETNGGCCGDEWETWGLTYLEDDENEGKIPPYEADGFERVDLNDLSNLQICRSDDLWNNYYHSETVSFRRKN